VRRGVAIRRVFLASIIIVIFLIVLSFLAPSLGGLFRGLGLGIWKTRTQVLNNSGNVIEGAIKTGPILAQENKDLRNQLNLFSTLRFENKLLREENNTLRERLGRTDRVAPSILASILARPPLSAYDTLVLDAGASEGVTLGDTVVFGSVLLGKITVVDSHTSLANLLSTPGEKHMVLVGSTTAETVSYGRGGGNFYLRMPSGVPVSEGDVVSAPGSFPMILGNVARVEDASADSFRIILLRSPVNIQELKWIEIIPKH